MNILLFLFALLHSRESKIIKIPGYEETPAPFGFICKDAGSFPFEKDCQMFWYCKFNEGYKVLKEGLGTLEGSNNHDEENANHFERVKLYKCPKGYLYDNAVTFCQPSSKVECKNPRNQYHERQLIEPWGILNDFR